MFLKKADPTGKKYFWIGLTDLFHEGKFVWSSTGQAASYTNWETDQPDNSQRNEHFVHLFSSLQMRKWNDNYENKTGIYALCQFFS
jgi:hypothetical protein